MAKYSYLAKSPTGKEKTGIIEAKDIHQLAGTLKKQGFILIKAELAEKEVRKRKIEFSLPFFTSISLTEKMMFTRNLQVMISSGLSLPKALETLSLQTKSKKFRRVLEEIKVAVVKGKNFSDTLTNYPDIFSELFQNMIKVGEEAGNLDEVLNVLARQMEREHELKSKIKGALMYPAVVVLAMMGIGVLMLIMVVPKLASTFEELKIELPITTRIVIGLGNFLVEKWYLVFFVLTIFIFFFSILLKTKQGKQTVDYLFLRLPVISSLIKKTNSAYTVRTLSSLIAAGVPIVRSLEIVSGVLGNVYYKKIIAEAANEVRKGKKLSETLMSHQDLYPLVVLQMLKVGEETGETSNILAKLADFFEEEVGNATKNLASVVEPVLLLIVGAAIGFFAISMIQPMYSMLGSL